MSGGSVITAPWSPEQVASLNTYQRLDAFHPYTCGEPHCDGELVAGVDGWVCPTCGYTQLWAYSFSAGPWDTL